MRGKRGQVMLFVCCPRRSSFPRTHVHGAPRHEGRHAAVQVRRQQLWAVVLAETDTGRETAPPHNAAVLQCRNDKKWACKGATFHFRCSRVPVRSATPRSRCAGAPQPHPRTSPFRRAAASAKSCCVSITEETRPFRANPSKALPRIVRVGPASGPEGPPGVPTYILGALCQGG